MDRRNRNILIAGLAALVILVCIGSFSIVGAVTYMLIRAPGEPLVVAVRTQATTQPPGPRPQITPLPTAQQDRPEQKATPLPDRAQLPDGVIILPPKAEYSTERLLVETIVPTRDLRDLALRLKPGIDDIPLVVNEHTPDYEVGERIQFWAANVDANDHFPIMAELIHKTDVAYAWVEVDRPHDVEAISRSVDTFSENVYATVRTFFGSEWKPGVDNDPRLHILHATNLGESIAGYYSSADQFSSLANEFSNEKEMFYISLSWLNNTRDYEYYETVLAHEFQHMIHWANDRNEETWVNEGLSELAQEIAGYPPDTGFASQFLGVPDTQLNTWSDNPAGNGEHYGSAYLFMAYFLQRFGPEMTQAVVAHPANGIAGFDEALAEAGHPERFEDIFADWVVANYLDDPEALGMDDLYGYGEIDLPQPAEDKVYRRYPIDTRRTTVQNYATDYLVFRGRENIQIVFQGETETRLANVQPYSGRFMWWSNRADDSNSRLTRLFDFSQVSETTSLEMEVSMWWDIEDDYDYGYVTVSEDGQKWTILPGQRTTTENPSGNSFGHGYTSESAPASGSAAEWVTERFDLSDYAGQEVFVRFEYVTDDAVNYPGWFVDDIRIPAIDYAIDFEDGAGDWESEGWLLTDNRLQQRWLLQILEMEGDQLVNVHRVPVDDLGQAVVDIDNLGGDTFAVLIVNAMAPVTTEAAEYEYRIDAR